jgi:exopolysaccharide biosynthesis predicted pyruvyltransferase EpsI
MNSKNRSNNKPNKVVVHGSYFVNNFGDTLLIKLLCDKVAMYVGEDNIRLAIHGDKSEQISIGYPVIRKEEMDDVSDVFFSGGGYFGEPNVSWLRKWRWAFRNYKRHFSWNKPFYNSRFHIIGVGVGPIENIFYRALVRKFFNRCDNILVRDNESKNYCSEYFPELENVDLCVDLALGTPNLDLEKNKIAIHLDTSDSSVIYDVLLYMKERLSEHSEKKITLIFDNNVSFSEKTITKYKKELDKAGYCDSEFEFEEYKDYSTLIETLSSSELVITSKLHVGILTISQFGKVIAIPNHSKTKRLYSQLSISEFCIERSAFNIHDFDNAYKNLNCFKPDYSVRDEGIKSINNRIESIFKERKNEC